jgi:hypothetical protein
VVQTVFFRFLKIYDCLLICQLSPAFSFGEPLRAVGAFKHRASTAEHLHIVARKSVGHGSHLLIRQLHPTPDFPVASLQWRGPFVKRIVSLYHNADTSFASLTNSNIYGDIKEIKALGAG